MAHTFCYAQCRAYAALNHTDAKALVVCPNARLWHWCGCSKFYLFLFLILKTVTTTNPITPIRGVPKINQSSVICGRNLKCPWDPATPTIRRKQPTIVTPQKNTVNNFIIYLSSYGFVPIFSSLIQCFRQSTLSWPLEVVWVWMCQAVID